MNRCDRCGGALLRDYEGITCLACGRSPTEAGETAPAKTRDTVTPNSKPSKVPAVLQGPRRGLGGATVRARYERERAAVRAERLT